MKKKLAVLMAVAMVLPCLMPTAVKACPAYPGDIVVDVDGSEDLVVRNHGDEFFSYITDKDGNLLYCDPEGDFWYVGVDGDSLTQGYRVGESGAGVTRANINDEISNLEQKIENFQQVQAAIESQTVAATDPEPIPENYNYDNDLLKGKWKEIDDSKIEKPEKAATCPMLVIKVQFDDIKCLFSDSEWNQKFFGTEKTSVADYYHQVSNGKFTYVPAAESFGTANDGVVTVELPIRRPRYLAVPEGQNYSNGVRAGIYPAEEGNKNYAIYNDSSFYTYGLEAADQYIDFSQYDRNNDQYISPTELAVIVVAAGYEAAAMGSTKTGDDAVMTWAHSWTANNFLQYGDTVKGSQLAIELDNVDLYKYTIVGENLGGSYDYNTKEGKKIQSQIGTPCHELGHDLGLPDLYNTDWRNYPDQEHEVGGLSLMAGGNWNTMVGEEPGSMPSLLDPYSKNFLKFYDEDVAKVSGMYSLNMAGDSANYNIMRVNTENPDVYYLVENRFFGGYDRGQVRNYADTNGGVVCWRINEEVVNDKWNANTINSESGNYGIMPVFMPGEIPFLNSETCTSEDEIVVSCSPKTMLKNFDDANPVMNVQMDVLPRYKVGFKAISMSRLPD